MAKVAAKAKDRPVKKKQTVGMKILTILFSIVSVFYVAPVFIVLMNSFKSNAAISRAIFEFPNANSFQGFQSYMTGMFHGIYKQKKHNNSLAIHFIRITVHDFKLQLLFGIRYSISHKQIVYIQSWRNLTNEICTIIRTISSRFHTKDYLCPLVGKMSLNQIFIHTISKEASLPYEPAHGPQPEVGAAAGHGVSPVHLAALVVAVVVQAGLFVPHVLFDVHKLLVAVNAALHLVIAGLILHVEGLGHVGAVQPDLPRVDILVPEVALLGAGLASTKESDLQTSTHPPYLISTK